MADAVLLLKGKLGKADIRVYRAEDGIKAEAPSTPPLKPYITVERTIEDITSSRIGHKEDQIGPEHGAAPIQGQSLKLTEESLDPLFICCAVPGRIDTGPSIEGRHFETRVISQGGYIEPGTDLSRLFPGVTRVVTRILVNNDLFRKVCQGMESIKEAGQFPGDLPEFPLIARGNNDFLHFEALREAHGAA